MHDACTIWTLQSEVAYAAQTLVSVSSLVWRIRLGLVSWSCVGDNVLMDNVSVSTSVYYCLALRYLLIVRVV